MNFVWSTENEETKWNLSVTKYLPYDLEITSHTTSFKVCPDAIKGRSSTNRRRKVRRAAERTGTYL